MRDRLVFGLRLIVSIGTIIALIGAGFNYRSPWIILLATPPLTVLYILGKWSSWQLAWRLGGLNRIVAAIFATIPVQAMVGGLFYLIGLGLGTLFGPATQIASLSTVDVTMTAVLFVIGLALAVLVASLSSSLPAIAGETAPETNQKTDAVEDVELDIDPTPLRLETFFKSRGIHHFDAARQAMEGRGETRVEKLPIGADDERIAEAEQRLGVRLPETLRKLYRIMDGGYVGWMHVALKGDPRPLYEDWRGAFSIDYSSLAPLRRLTTVAAHYEDFTHEPEEVPTDAEHMIILQARYGDMTLLDYSQGPEPRVVIADFDKQRDPVDITFENFDTFFAALRRNRDKSSGISLGAPVDALDSADFAEKFWSKEEVHPFHNAAKSREDGQAPQKLADDELIAVTEARIGVVLPPSMTDLFRRQNGGHVAYRYIEDVPGSAIARDEVLPALAPLEYIVSLAELSSRVDFRSGARPWPEIFEGADKLFLLETATGGAAMLDYRDGTVSEPAVLIVEDLDTGKIAHRFSTFDMLIANLRAFEFKG